jgi:F-type H+-transporting ATPase subunit b
VKRAGCVKRAGSVRKILARTVLAAALLSTPILAQEAEHKSESGGEKPGMELWKWANFAILAGVLGYLISKNMGPVLVARSLEIQEGLAAGERAKSEADTRASVVKAQLSGLDQAITQMKTSAKEEREREVARLRRETAAELARIQQHAQMEIESAGKLARFEIQRAAAKAAIELAEQKVRARMTPDVQEALLQSFASEVAHAGGSKLTSHEF